MNTEESNKIKLMMETKTLNIRGMQWNIELECALKKCYIHNLELAEVKRKGEKIIITCKRSYILLLCSET